MPASISVWTDKLVIRRARVVFFFKVTAAGHNVMKVQKLFETSSFCNDTRDQRLC